MIVRLHNLAARAPRFSDLEAVTELLVVCDAVESCIAEPTEEDVHTAWQSSDFCLGTDAWVIVTQQGQLVGYADVRRGERGQLVSLIRVHPDYRRRGIGTLLIWLTEDRARQLLRTFCTEEHVALTITVNSVDTGAPKLLEREGYTLASHFWRLVIDVDEAPRASNELPTQRGKLKLDLVIDSRTLLSASNKQRTGIYIAHQYDVYEKVLRQGPEQPFDALLDVKCISV